MGINASGLVDLWELAFYWWPLRFDLFVDQVLGRRVEQLLGGFRWYQWLDDKSKTWGDRP